VEPFAFNDLVEPGQPIRILARIAVLTPEEGGKQRPFTKGYRPNHNFGGPEDTDFYIGQIEVPEGTWIRPGEAHDLMVTFMHGPGLSDLLRVGRAWRIQEGSNLVATGHVLGRQGEA